MARAGSPGRAVWEQQTGSCVPAGDHRIGRVGCAVGDEAEFDGVAGLGKSAPGGRDLGKDRRAPFDRGRGEVRGIDGCAAVDGVLHLAVGVGRAPAVQDDVVEVAGTVNLDAEPDHRIGLAVEVLAQGSDACLPRDHPLVVVTGDADPGGAWWWQGADHAPVSRNSGLGCRSCVTARSVSSVSGLSGKAVRIAAGMRRWVRSE